MQGFGDIAKTFDLRRRRAEVGATGIERHRLRRKAGVWKEKQMSAADKRPFILSTHCEHGVQLRPVVLRDGGLEEVDPLSGAASRDFPDPVGTAEGIYTLHSELATLPIRYPTLREASFRLCLAPGLIEKLRALPEGEEPEPDMQSSASVSAHVVEARNGDGSAVVGTSLTRGGSARSTSGPAARAALELLEGRLSAPGVKAPEDAVADPEGFLALLGTEVTWS